MDFCDETSQVDLEDVNLEDVAMDLTELLALEPDALEGASEGYFQYRTRLLRIKDCDAINIYKSY